MRSRKPRVLIIGPTPPPYHGISTFLESFLQSPELLSRIDALHLDTADRRSLENLGRLDLTNVVLGVRHAAQLTAMVARYRPDGIYFEVSQNAWAYARDSTWIAIASLSRVPVGVRLNGSDFRRFTDESGMLLRQLIRRSSARLARVAVLSDSLRPIYEGLVPDERVDVVPNGIADPYAAAPWAERLEARRSDHDRPFTAAYLGALYTPKGIIDFLEAAARVRRSRPDIRFVAAGGWVSEADRAAGEASLTAHDTRDIIGFPGVVSGGAKLKLLLDADAFVFPGIQPEGQPFVILEAMAAALPVIATAKGAIRDTVSDGVTGTIVPDRSPDAIAAAIVDLAADPRRARRIGQAGRDRFLEHFTAGVCNTKLVSFMERVAAQVNGRSRAPASKGGARKGMAGA